MKKFICPICEKPYEFALHTWQDKEKKWLCEHDNPTPDKISLKRHQNYDLSSEALKMATIQRQADAETNPEVEVRSYQKGSSGQVVKIPEKVIKSIEKKVEDNPALQE